MVFPWLVPPQGPWAGTGQWPLSQVSPECREQAELGYTQLMGLMKFLVFETSYLWQDLETVLNYMEGKAFVSSLSKFSL